MRKLPPGDTISHALRSTFDNLGFAFHVSWPWMAILLPITMVTTLYVLANAPETPDQFTPDLLLANVIQALASSVAFASIAVNWHRYILRDEVPQGKDRLRLDGTVLRYIGNFIAIVLILAIGILIASLVIGVLFAISEVLGGVVAFVAGLPAVFYFVVYSYRLSVKLPAVALGRRDYGFRDAVDNTKDNNWNIFGMAFLFFLLVLAVVLALLAVSYLLQLLGDLGAPAIILIQFGVNWVATILGVTMLTSLYGFFVEGRDF